MTIRYRHTSLPCRPMTLHPSVAIYRVHTATPTRWAGRTNIPEASTASWYCSPEDPAAWRNVARKRVGMNFSGNDTCLLHCVVYAGGCGLAGYKSWNVGQSVSFALHRQTREEGADLEMKIISRPVCSTCWPFDPRVRDAKGEVTWKTVLGECWLKHRTFVSVEVVSGNQLESSTKVIAR